MPASADRPNAVDENHFLLPRKTSVAPAATIFLRAYEEGALGWFWSTDCDGRVTYMSTEMMPLLGQNELLGQTFSDLFARAEGEQHDGRTLPFLLQKRSRFEKVLVHPSAEAADRYWAVSGSPRFDLKGEFLGFVGSGIDVTDQRTSAAESTRLAMFDTLTGLPNRLRFNHVLHRILKRRESHRTPCAVLLIDLDRFKQVNDTLGHPAGDALLSQVADRLLRIVGDKEHVFRLGGDEFQVILPGYSDSDAVKAMAERIISSVSQPYSVEGSRCIIGASVGIALAGTDGCTSEELVRNADLALYSAKGAGRGCAHFFSSDLLRTAEDRRVLEEDLRDALARGEMNVFYQPVVNAATECTTAVEALVRWHHPERGSISPSLFIPIAEEANLIGALGEWILRKACEDAASWPGCIKVAVNVSPIQFTSGGLPALVTSALASSGLAPERLELEITEGVFLSDSAQADRVFASLKDIGVRLALDDFGTGYSSLAYLRTAPFDKIKIDQSFVRAATLPGSRNAAIIAAIVALAEALGMETTAEGIESLDQLDLVKSLRVSHIQGYIYSQAIAADELRERLLLGEWKILPVGPSKQRSERLSMYRKVRAIFGNHCRPVLVRNLSESGALAEGLDDVPFGSRLIIDFGQGHLVFAKVLRSRNRQQGLVFEETLVSDEAGGFRTRKPVSAYLLERGGIPSLSHGGGSMTPSGDNAQLLDELGSKLGMASMALGSGDSGSETSAPSSRTERQPRISPLLSVTQLIQHSRALFEDSGASSKSEWQALNEHVVPAFGQRRFDELTPTLVGGWLKSKAERDDFDPETVAQLQAALGRLYSQAVHLIGGTAVKPSSQDGSGRRARNVHERPLNTDEIDRLLHASQDSANPQLKFIVRLLIHTRVRQRDLLEARWDQVDLDKGEWVIPPSNGGTARCVALSPTAVEIFRSLARWDGCPFVVANPVTQKPYRSFATSWDTARTKAGIPDVEIDDLRYCSIEEIRPVHSNDRYTSRMVRNFINRA
jgi:diguanylate cyclase (GGDEF)-like protein/PAS domain S-box-containing protein